MQHRPLPPTYSDTPEVVLRHLSTILPNFTVEAAVSKDVLLNSRIRWEHYFFLSVKLVRVAHSFEVCVMLALASMCKWAEWVEEPHFFLYELALSGLFVHIVINAKPSFFFSFFLQKPLRPLVSVKLVFCLVDIYFCFTDNCFVLLLMTFNHKTNCLTMHSRLLLTST